MAIGHSTSLADDLFLGADAGEVSVSPDAQSIAWAPKLDFQHLSENNKTFLSLMDARRSLRTVSVPNHFAIDFAVANGGRRILVLAGLRGAAGRRLLMLRPDSGGLEQDLTNLMEGFPLGESTKLSVSGTGQFAAISTEREYAVLDTVRSAVLLRAEGHSASLSPGGDNFAFLDGALGLVIRGIGGSSLTRLMNWSRIQGIGAWSPDGKYLLVGAFVALSLYKRLVVVAGSGDTCELAKLGEGDDGSRSAWIKNSLLQR
jgi:hypothetical protein